MAEGLNHHPGVAAVLSFVFSGLGQIYNGQIKRGLLLIALSSLGIVSIIIGAVIIIYWIKLQFGNITQNLIMGVALFLSGLILVVVLGIYSIFDAYKVAKAKNNC